MAYKTINVSQGTYDRLVLYKHANMTFDDVLNELMNVIPEEEFYMKILKEHRKEVEKIKKGDYLSENELEDLLDSDE